jgi:hypothetical protein
LDSGGTREAIGVMRIISERVLDVKEEGFRSSEMEEINEDPTENWN